jgi:hypothetical protein
VHKVSQVGAEQARIEPQVVILERLGTLVKLAVHLAQVSQVDQVPWDVDAFQGRVAIKGFKAAKTAT